MLHLFDQPDGLVVKFRVVRLDERGAQQCQFGRGVFGMTRLQLERVVQRFHDFFVRSLLRQLFQRGFEQGVGVQFDERRDQGDDRDDAEQNRIRDAPLGQTGHDRRPDRFVPADGGHTAETQKDERGQKRVAHFKVDQAVRQERNGHDVKQDAVFFEFGTPADRLPDEQNKDRQQKRGKNGNADRADFDPILQIKIVRLPARIRVVLVLLVQRRPSAAARAEHRVVPDHFEGVPVKRRPFQHAVLFEVDVFDPLPQRVGQHVRDGRIAEQNERAERTQ